MEARLNRVVLRTAGICVVALTLATATTQAFGQILAPGMGGHIPPNPQGQFAPPGGNVRAANAPGRSQGRPHPSQKAVVQSQNFIVFANHPEWAQEVVQVAEQLRSDLAVYWLGTELPAWPQRCPLHVNDAENLGAGGETRFALQRGVPGNWMMSVQGTRQRILDSVLPHEITHTIFATHFGRTGKYVPRWADEGASTTVEHEAEKRKHRHFLQQFLKTGRGLAFNEMFRLKEYPQDILPLYAQGHSAVQFLLDQAGPRHFIKFLEMGMQTENWPAALQQHYAYQSIGDFQVSWNRWLLDGSPADLAAYAPLLRNQKPDPATPESVAPGSAAPDSLILASGSGSPGRLDEPAESFSGDKELGDLADNSSPQESQVGIPGDLAKVAGADSDSWFKRKLHQTSGSPATSIPPHNHFTGDPANSANNANPTNTALASNSHGADSPHRPASNSGQNFPGGVASAAPGGAQPMQSLVNARPQPYETPQIQVLDWGARQPVPGLNATPQSPSPILR